MKNRVSRVILLLMVVAAFAYFIMNFGKEDRVAAINQEATDFRLEDVDGVMHSLSDYRDKMIVLNYFATWCGPCVDEAPELEKFEQEYGDDIQLIIIDIGETKERVKKFIEKNQSSSLYLLDYKSEVKKQFGVTGQPETFIIDKSGIIREHYKGPLTKEELYTMVKAYQ